MREGFLPLPRVKQTEKTVKMATSLAEPEVGGQMGMSRVQLFSFCFPPIGPSVHQLPSIQGDRGSLLARVTISFLK